MVSDSSGPCDVSGWELNLRPLTGRYPKLELADSGQKYILKFAALQKQSGLEVPYQVSEYIASRVIKSLGYDVHEVALAEYRGRHGCLIKVFEEPLVTFDGLGTSTMSDENLPYDLDILHSLFSEGKYAGDFDGYMWDTFCIDAFIANLDRHPNNWGFFNRSGVYHSAPLFDNASSLYSLYAFALHKIPDLESHIKKFSRSMVSYRGERRSFEEILLSENSKTYRERLSVFKGRLNSLSLDSLESVCRVWPEYTPYTEFVKKFMDRQVKWFETQI